MARRLYHWTKNRLRDPARRRRLLWLLLATPGMAQLWLLTRAVWGRVGYPFDLEWMEGGMLAHAWQMTDGAGVYAQPSVDFIPYLYTPLYPALLALLEPVFGLSYTVARAISVLSIIAVVVLTHLALVRGARAHERGPAMAGALLAGGVMAATYPWVEGWYDIARADTLFLAMVIGGLTMLTGWARAGTGWSGHARVGVAAGILALSFFCKQTGVLYVAAGGGVLLVMNWRRVPVYVFVAGVIGLGGTWLMNRLTGGWFWTYVFEVHQAHDTNADRFWASFDHILFKFPVVTALIAIGLVISLGTWAVTRERPPSSTPLFVWSWVFAVSCLVGALGWATQWAHYNAYIPAMVTGGMAAGAALAAIAGAVGALAESPRPWLGRVPGWLGPMLAMIAAAALGAQLVEAWWQPTRFIPQARDVRAGHRLIERIGAMDGDVFMPFHPWYPHLAGKPLFVHRMGVMDVSYVHPERPHRRGEPPPWPVRGLDEAFANHRFSAIIWDNRPVDHYFRAINRYYRVDDVLTADEQPRLFTGARVVPRHIWVPNTPVEPPAGAAALWNFESGAFTGWTTQGSAWGTRPVTGPMARQGQVRGFLGKYYVSSMHGGDRSTGTMRSPVFTITGSRITVRVSGGEQLDALRVELRVSGGAEVRSGAGSGVGAGAGSGVGAGVGSDAGEPGDQAVFVATGKNSERMHTETWDVTAYRGRSASVVLIDESTTSWGHLNVDEIWQWQ